MSGGSPTTQQLVDQCQGLVRTLAMRIRRKLPKYVELEDLIAYGQIGLMEAGRDYDPSRGSRFSTYAYYRIRGAIYDGLSKMSWLSRAQYSRIRYEQMGNEVLGLESEEGTHAPAGGIESEMRWLRDVGRTLAVVYLASHHEFNQEAEACLSDPSAPSAPAEVISREISDKLHELIDALPPLARALIRATYFEGLTLQDAAKKLGVSKSWASRLHARTLQRLARSLRLQGVTS
jgi:RNA polymerase sigma factor for flagellar operon FliA